jgi:hypothetical protein
MPSSKEAVILGVIVLLTVTLILSSSYKFDAFALRQHVKTDVKCYHPPDDPTTLYRCCYSEYDSDNGLPKNFQTWCKNCNDEEGSLVCGNWYPSTSTHNPSPPSAGVKQPPPLQPPKKAPPLSTEQTTCPNGSAPDANGKCPPVIQDDSVSGSKEKGEHNGPTDT